MEYALKNILKSRNNYLLIYCIYNSPLLLQSNKSVIIIVFKAAIIAAAYDIIIILLFTTTCDIAIKINIIIINIIEI